MKKLVLLITLLITISYILVGCAFNEDGLQFKEEYEKLNGKSNSSGTNNYIDILIPKNNPIKYKSDKEIIKILEEGTGVIYFGFSSCPWCRTVVPVLLDAAKEMNLKTIYYVDVTSIRDILVLDENDEVIVEKEGTKSYYKILNILKDYIEDYLLTNDSGEIINTGKKRIYVPTVIFVKGGKIISSHIGTIPSQKKAYEKLTDEQKNELLEIFKTNIELIK